MQPFEPDAAFVIWLGTSPSTRKVAQVERDGRATLSYVHPSGPDYVTLVGHASVVRSDAERRRHWREGWDAFFPGGPTGANYLVIRFEPERIEIVSTTHEVAHRPAAPAPAMLERRGQSWILTTPGR
jgi:general stress protein 26